jgi:hypothetical protein
MGEKDSDSLRYIGSQIVINDFVLFTCEASSSESQLLPGLLDYYGSTTIPCPKDIRSGLAYKAILKARLCTGSSHIL